MAIDEFQRDVIDRLGRIELKLDNDYKTLHGNGKAGLVDRVTAIEAQLQVMAAKSTANKDWFSRIRDSIGWLATTAIAFYAAFLRP